jgi:hypothetical protein
MWGTKQLTKKICLLTSLNEFHKSRKLKNVHCYKTENNPWVLLSLSLSLSLSSDTDSMQRSHSHINKHPPLPLCKKASTTKKISWYVHGCIALSGLLPRFFPCWNWVPILAVNFFTKLGIEESLKFAATEILTLEFGNPNLRMQQPPFSSHKGNQSFPLGTMGKMKPPLKQQHAHRN